MNHVHTQPHSQHAEIKWKRITRPHVNEEIKNADGKNNKDGLGITVGSKRRHANYSVETVPDDKDDGKRIKTRVNLMHQRQRLQRSPTEHNDHYKLELPGAWKSTCSRCIH
nr:hypothetical protein CFP56_19691 [Quercus suber]